MTTKVNTNKGIVLFLACVAQFMVVLDIAIVNVALPSIQRDLHIGQSTLQWIVIAYGLMLGGFLLFGGRMADLLGRRRVLLAGLTFFSAASLLAGVAGSAGFLIGARALQGFGAALVPPAALSILAVTFKEGAERNRVFVSEESCPFCAAERWALAVAPSHLGTWSHLGTTRFSSTDVYPSTATLSFRTAAYRSAQLTLRTTELADSAGRPLQPQTALDTRLIRAYDVPPYVNSASQSGSVPFLDIGNRDILAGAQYNPQVLAGLSAAQIAARPRDPSTRPD
jgi:hypothetical protein